MAVKLRLRRQGRKQAPYYHIVAADARASRDGKFIEAMGSYDPNRNPAKIEVDHEKALKWLKNGAEPTDTVRAIFRYTGVMLKMHLHRKGKSESEIQAEYEKWNQEKQSKIQNKVLTLQDKRKADKSARQVAEGKRREEYAARVAAKSVPPAEEPQAAESTESAEAPATE